jgi:catechol 2,3-dioxygenase-like lactoylglutathione lyase family enzyme
MTVLVENLDAAAGFYASAFGFVRLYDETLPTGFRAVHVGPPGQSGVGLWLIPASAEDVRRQAAGHPIMVLYTDDLQFELSRLANFGVEPSEEPVRDAARGEAYAHVPDLYGNDIVLVELAATPSAASPV